MTDQFSNDALLDVFIYETTQLLEKLETVILINEKNRCLSDEAISEIFRIMHTIKGSSAMMEYDNVSALAHAMEDLFYYIREKKPETINYPLLTDIILSCLDFFKIEIVKISSGRIPDGEFTNLKRVIEDFLIVLKQKLESTAVTGFDDEMSYYKAVIFFDEGIQMENIHAFSIVRSLEKSQNDIMYFPQDIATNSDSAVIIRKDGFRVYIKSRESYEAIRRLFLESVFVGKFELLKLENEMELQERFSQRIDAEPKAEEVNELRKQEPEAISQGKDMQFTSSQPSMISVNVLKLDKLMDLVGEIVIAEAMVIQNSDLKGLQLSNFNKASRQLKKITDELQDTVMDIRMVPLAATFHKMNRLVRDMSKKLNKDVKLELIGEETEVDKNIIEHISDPLMHLVRNSMDHGIEAQEERVAKGKRPTGTITLEAKNAGSDVLIIIKDDGKGLNRERIINKARENNLISKPDMEMTDREVYSLILFPGFFTKEEVTEFSGRGVGMDVVQKSIEMVGGSVLIDSEKDLGTVIMLKIPLTLAIIDGMNIKVGNSHYTIPTISVKEFFKTNVKNIITDPNGNEMILVRGQCYPILRLHELYGVSEAIAAMENGIIIMVEQDENMICIFADELLGQQQVVVKTLPDYVRKMKRITGLTGCTLLGDGSISLILDIADLISYVNGSK